MDGLELLLYHKVGNLAEFQQRALIGVQGHHKDGHCVGIGLGYGGRIAVAREHSLGARYLVTYVVGGGLKIDRELKLYGDSAVAVLADR